MLGARSNGNHQKEQPSETPETMLRWCSHQRANKSRKHKMNFSGSSQQMVEADRALFWRPLWGDFNARSGYGINFGNPRARAKSRADFRTRASKGSFWHPQAALWGHSRFSRSPQQGLIFTGARSPRQGAHFYGASFSLWAWHGAHFTASWGANFRAGLSMGLDLTRLGGVIFAHCPAWS